VGPSALAAIVIAIPCAVAAQPPDGNTNPTLSLWFKNLRQPGTSLPCCSISDCRRVDYRVASDGEYEVYVEGTWYKVPDDRILKQTGNPGIRRSDRDIVLRA
jgi:hypothetical protein